MILIVAVAALWLMLPAVASAEVVVQLDAPGGALTAWPERASAELDLDGQTPILFEDARITLRRNRVTVVARDRGHTLYAWANRANGSGGIGLLIRPADRRRRTESVALRTYRLRVTGEPEPRVIQTRR